MSLSILLPSRHNCRAFLLEQVAEETVSDLQLPRGYSHVRADGCRQAGFDLYSALGIHEVVHQMNTSVALR